MIAKPDTILWQKVDLLRYSVENLSGDVLSMSYQTDSLQMAVTQLAAGQSVNQSEFDSLAGQLNNIAEYGMGFSDAAAHIAMPLIVALYAFAFTFLITVITHVKKEYNSAAISKMFSSEKTYNCFIWGSGISVGILIVLGLLSLAFTGAWHRGFLVVLNWASMVVAGVYAIIIFSFAMTCIKYTDPQKILGLIDEHFATDYKKGTAYKKKQERKEKKNEKEKSEGKKHFRGIGIHLNKVYATYGAEKMRTDRVVGLCKYAIEKQNKELFLNCLYKAKDLDVEGSNGKKETYQLVSFFDAIMDVCISIQHDEKIEHSLFLTWFQSFKHNQLPSPGVVYKMLGKMVESVKKGRISLFENYMQLSRYGFSFIDKLPQASYVGGSNTEEQIKTAKECRKYWMDLQDMHYLAMAYLFTNGHTGILKVLFNGGGFYRNNVVPRTTTSILKVFIRCKKDQDETGRFQHYWFLDQVIGDNYEIDMLEKFTAMMLLLATEGCEEKGLLVDSESIEQIRLYEGALIAFGEIWKKSADLCGRYPNIVEKDVKALVENSIECLDDGRIPEDTSILQWWRELFGFAKKAKKERYIYEEDIQEKGKESVIVMFRNIIYGNLQSIIDRLSGDMTEDKTAQIGVNAYTFLTKKQALMGEDFWRHYGVFNGMMQLFKNRYQCVVYEALSQMSTVEVSTKWEDFEECFLTHVGDKGAEYIIIDTDCSMNLFVKMDELEDGVGFSINRNYKGAYYYHVELNASFYLQDLPVAEAFRNTITIVKYTDLPVPVTMSDDDCPDVQFRDESDRTQAKAAVRITVDPKLIVRYNKQAELLRVRIVK